MTMSVSTTPFAELSTLVTTFIAENDQKSGNTSSATIESATHLLIAIANAENIFKDCSSEQKPILTSKIEEFIRMIVSNQRTFEFSVPIRALPTNPGKIELAFREGS